MILNERSSGTSRLDSLKNRIARDVMGVIKGVIPDDAEVNTEEEYDLSVTLSNYVWTKNIDKSLPDKYDSEVDDPPGSNLFFDVVVNIESDPALQSPFDIRGYALSDVIIPEIEIQISKRDLDIDPSNFQDLRKDLGNAIRHELEHLTQKGMFKSFDRGERYYQFSIQDSVTSSTAKYFLKKEEVPAFVTGFADQSSSMEDLKKNIRQMLDRYADSGKITHQEEDIVFSAWIDWAKRNLNKKKFM